MSTFDIDTRAGITTVRSLYGKAAEFEHGFIGKGVLAPKLSWKEAHAALCSYFNHQSILLPKQTHGDTIVTAYNSRSFREVEADALIIDHNNTEELIGCIQTADCIPLLCFMKSKVALIHSGWRGLANKIIEKTLRLQSGDYSSIEILIGPSAGSQSYQVGPEVIEAIGESCVYKSEGDGRALLDLAATAIKQVAALSSDIKIFSSNLCTMTDPRFYSHRRDTDYAGRNVSFIKVKRPNDCSKKSPL